MSKKRAPIVPPKPSRAFVRLLTASSLIPFVIILPLIAMNVRLGQGYFAYRYSPVRDLRIPRTAPLLVVAALLAGSVLLLSQSAKAKRRFGLALFGIAIVGMTAWNWWAPPAPVNQQMFNMTSFSSDGAFAVEARDITSVSRYLHDFPKRLETSIQEMGGTRVLSNPPLTTVIAYAVTHAFAGGRDGWMEQALAAHHDIEPADATMVANALRVSVALSVLWALSAAVAYFLGRVFLSSAGAVVFATLVTFNPCTVHFAPGKDVAQLLTINLMLWAWFAGWKRRSMLLSGLSGAILVIGATAGLVHIWMALIALIVTSWEMRRSIGELLLRMIVPATIGAIAVCAIAFIALDWNIPLTLLAVSSRWTAIQKTFDMNRFTWFMIGLPILALFFSPGWWTLGALSARRPRWNFGTRLVLCTAGVALFIYVVMGVTYELPRLWIAFFPPLLLGLAIDRPLMRARGEHPRIARALALIVVIQILFTALHWTMFDAREAEFRLTSQRYYN